MQGIELWEGDCLDLMDDIPDKSINMILCDLPYGMTAFSWDIIIPFELLWNQYNRIITDNGAILLFSSQPFTSMLLMSNQKMFKYELIWNKLHGTDFQLANKKPMKSHENILVFGKHTLTYNKQTTLRNHSIDTTNWKQDKRNKDHNNFSSKSNMRKVYKEKNPTTVIDYSLSNAECNNTKRLHPTQKPVKLLEYLIKTYTNEQEIVLDNCMGSGSTGIACLNLERKFIGIEKNERYFQIAKNRIENHIIIKNINNDIEFF